MKNVRTRLKKAFSVHGTMKTPSREATLIIDTLRKPKPHTAEREKTRARHYRGSWHGEMGRTPRPRIWAGGKGWLRVYAPMPGPATLHQSVSPFAPDTSTATQTIIFVAGQVERKPPGYLEEVFPSQLWPRGMGKSSAALRAADPRTWASSEPGHLEFSIHRWLEASETTPSHPQGLTARPPSSSYPGEPCCGHSSDLRHVQPGAKPHCEPTAQTTPRKTRQDSWPL